jgi:hypothetical protein
VVWGCGMGCDGCDGAGVVVWGVMGQELWYGVVVWGVMGVMWQELWYGVRAE